MHVIIYNFIAFLQYRQLAIDFLLQMIFLFINITKYKLHKNPAKNPNPI